MSCIKNLLREIQPTGFYAYYDRIVILVVQPLSPNFLNELWNEGNFGRGVVKVGQESIQPLIVINGHPAKHAWRYRQKIEINRPTWRGLQLIERCLPADAWIYYVEVAYEVVADRASVELLAEVFRNGFLQPWHGNREAVSYRHGFTTRKNPAKGKPRNGRWFVWYNDHVSKYTGEEDCFRVEGRHQGSAAVRNIGIQRPHDFLTFDFDAYFARHIRFWQLDLERLGRCHQNRLNGHKRKRSMIGPLGVNLDRMRGIVLYRKHSWHEDEQKEREIKNGVKDRFANHSLQRLVDSYGRGKPRPYLKPIPPIHYRIVQGKDLSTSPDTLRTKGKHSTFWHSPLMTVKSCYCTPVRETSTDGDHPLERIKRTALNLRLVAQNDVQQ
jgi:hypothetical protein